MRTSPTILCGFAASMLLTTIAIAAEPAPAPAPAAPAADPMQQTVCRKQMETGSLVRAKKTCHTRAQWAYIDDVNQGDARKFADDSMGRPSGN